MQALMLLGEVPNPVTGKKEADLDQAKYIIDMMSMLKDKTKGNLSKDEDRLVEQALYELQMKFAAKVK